MVKDEIGNRYGRLVVIGREPNYEKVWVDGDSRKSWYEKARWRCRCDCGNEVIVVGDSLRRGMTKSCGCARVEHMREIGKMPNPGHKKRDLIGVRFGILTVIRIAGKSREATTWLCKCDCGNYTEVRGNSLVSGNTRSCGCGRCKKVG